MATDSVTWGAIGVWAVGLILLAGNGSSGGGNSDSGSADVGGAVVEANPSPLSGSSGSTVEQAVEPDVRLEDLDEPDDTVALSGNRYEADGELCEMFSHGPFVSLATHDTVAADYAIVDSGDPGGEQDWTEARCELHSPDETGSADAGSEDLEDTELILTVDARFMGGPDQGYGMWEAMAEPWMEDLYGPLDHSPPDPGGGDRWTHGRVMSSENPDRGEEVTTVDALDGNLYLSCRLQRVGMADITDDHAAKACGAILQDVFARHRSDG